ncbi:type IV pilus biogenesis/stability protein PilW [Pseudidiomarina aestuarii]|uniref:Type IV pilus biogenesis/stability protein PilW n=1 Tax=Pseudidiomarina aestuarii TaxID=624146 RepID=A0A7Z6ZUJ2_9GAMM|nr:type IV pilus biogenesis/stability protein PilW [Pseudidiomarina aestuarii]RUO41684.1 type IV pilus biogenesis/stability protein PilW [Pseudidiomarina aestuarii]
MRAVIIISLVTLVTLTGCVSKRTVDGKDQPAQTFNAEEAASTRLALGLQYLRSGNFQQAKANLERAREYQPNDPEVFTGLAYYHQQVQEFAQAEQYYEQAMRLDPDNGDTMNNLGALLCTQGRYAEADKYFREAVEQPRYVRVASTYENAARCAAEAGRLADADRYYQLAVNHSSRNNQILERYATWLLEQGRTADALRMIERRAQQPQLSAQYLWLEVQLAQYTQNAAKQRQFGDLLLERFPQSQQAEQYRQLTN